MLSIVAITLGLKLTDQTPPFMEWSTLTPCSSALCLARALLMQFSSYVRQLQEKHFAANKPLYLAFVDLEKAFDQVPRKVLGVEEWAVRVIQGVYTNVRSRVRVNWQYSEEFGVGVGVRWMSIKYVDFFPNFGHFSMYSINISSTYNFILSQSLVQI